MTAAGLVTGAALAFVLLARDLSQRGGGGRSQRFAVALPLLAITFVALVAARVAQYL